MFAKVFGHARRILSRSPSLQDISSESKEPKEPKESTPRRSPRSSAPVAEMVTSTRRGPIEDRSAPSTPSSSARKSKRQLETEETPTGAKKRRTSAGAKKTSLNKVHPSPTKSDGKPEHVDSTADTTEVETKLVEKLPHRRRSSPQVVIRTTSSPSQDDADTGSNTVEDETATTPDEPEASVKTPRQQKVASTPRSTRASEKTKQKQEEKKVAAASEQAVEAPAPISETKPQNTRIRFGSEEPAETKTSTAVQVEKSVVPEPAPAATDDYESDSDEAPEEVTVASAMNKVKAAETEAARAIKAQEDKQELKRKERAERIAEEQRVKRERLAEEERKKKNKEVRKAKKLAKMEAQAQEAPQSFVPNYIGEIPALLPESLLEAVGDRRPPTPPSLLPVLSAAEMQKEKLKRHIRFLERGEKPIKDVKKGSLSLRVLGEHDAVRAPKANKETKDIREQWLKGRQRETNKAHKKACRKMEFKKVERRATGGGFLRGED